MPYKPLARALRGIRHQKPAHALPSPRQGRCEAFDTRSQRMPCHRLGAPRTRSPCHRLGSADFEQRWCFWHYIFIGPKNMTQFWSLRVEWHTHGSRGQWARVSPTTQVTEFFDPTLLRFPTLVRLQPALSCDSALAGQVSLRCNVVSVPCPKFRFSDSWHF